ncbi:MAG: ABC transporter permease subunit [Pirellulales bacterium]|nr:ABC transporter permease subunit [Pirellulales bacterium]
MFVGPVFHREVSIAPRRLRIYVARTTYAAGLLLLVFTAWMVVCGSQNVGDLGDLARFGTILFQLLATLQLAWAVFFSAMLAAAAVAQEKDRKTLLLLLLTRLTNSELVLGKLFAGMLSVFVMLLAGLPLFIMLALLGGISAEQIARVFAVTLAAALACGSLGSFIALWREKTFQALALTVLTLVLWIALGEILAGGVAGETWWGISCKTLACGISPWQAIREAAQPWTSVDPALGGLQSPIYLFLLVSLSIAAAINLLAIAMVRVWNPSREAMPQTIEEAAPAKETIFDTEERLTKTAAASRAWRYPFGSNAAASQAAGAAPPKTITKTARTRHVWDNPIIWREIRTWAYGRKTLFIRLAYLLLFALAAGSLHWMIRTGQLPQYAHGAAVLVPLFLLSLILVNAQAVTSLTSERDAKALDLLLATDLSPKEIVFGKLGGVFFNTKEMVVLPPALCVYLGASGALSAENTVFLVVGLLVMYLFAAMLGLHAGISYGTSASAIATSLGTLFFMTIGVAACMRIMLAFSGSFEAQFVPFFAYMVLGGAGLYVVLGARNPSAAIGLASFLCPFATFYAITSYLQNFTLAMLFSIVAAYGFTTVAMLIPAIFEFDIATGRTTLDE